MIKAFLLKPAINDGSIESYKLSGQAILGNSAYYQENVKLQSYHALLEIAKDNLEVGKHPILDAPYVKELQRGYLQEVVNPFFKGMKYQTKMIFCYADEEVIKQRMKERNLARDRTKLISEEAWMTFLEEQPILPRELEGISHVKVDTNMSLEDKLRMAMDYLTAYST